MNTPGRPFFVCLLTSLLLYLACAEELPPPGGEADTAGPYLLGSEPASGAVNVEPGNEVTLYFSEHITKPTRGEAIFISPRPSVEPKIKWRSDRVTVILAGSFAADQTYIISAGTAIKDLRGNQLDSTLTVAFTTGAVIAEGRTAGRIFDKKGQPKSDLMVALYRPSELQVGTPLDSVDALYIAQTNAEGEFSIGYLPDERFDLIAYDDQNHNGRFNSGHEPFAVPDRHILIGGGVPLEQLMLTLNERDTIPPEILSAALMPDGMLRLRLSRTIDLKQLSEHPYRCVLTSADSSLVKPAVALLESADEPQAMLNFWPGQLLEGEYTISLTYDGARDPISFPTVTVTDDEDDNPPRIERFLPDNIPMFADEVVIELTFSEPLDTTLFTPETFLLWLQPDTPVEVTPSWRDPLRLLLTPDTLEPGARYRLEITEFELADLSGNRVGDSLRQHVFTIIDADSLGSISGETMIEIAGKENDSVMLSFSKVGEHRTFDMATSSGAFRIDLPAGKYLLSGFVDSDGDGEKGNGSVEPYALAETMAEYPDTIAVRARFETAGIQFEFR